MKIFKFLIIIIVVISIFSSCKKDEEHLGKRKLSEVQAWTYDLAEQTSSEIVNLLPAVDEQDNIYIISEGNLSENFGKITSLTKDGVKRWTVQTDGSVINRIVYRTDKIYFLTYFEQTGNVYQKLNCIDANTGANVWSVKSLARYGAFAVSDTKIYWALGDSIFSYSTSGQHLSSYALPYEYGASFKFMSCYNNEIFIIDEYGNTGMEDIWKFKDDATGLTFDWHLMFSIDNGFAISESNGVCDISINNDGGIYVITDQYLYAIANDGTIKWKTDKVRTYNSFNRYSTTITDSGYVLAANIDFFKFNDKGGVVYDLTNYEMAGYEMERAPLIAKDKRYYTVDVGGTEGGVRSINPDGTLYWYSFLPVGQENVAMLHNGNLVYVYENKVYCIKTEAGGLDETAQWPKMYYDYGNTGYKK